MPFVEHSYNERNHISAIFSVTVDFNEKGKRMFGCLQPASVYHFQEPLHGKPFYSESDVLRASYESVRENIVDTINNDLELIAVTTSDGAVQSINVLETRRGSILVLFEVTFNAMQFISGVKDFYDSIKLIKELANTHIKNRLQASYGDYFDVDTVSLTQQEEKVKQHIPLSGNKRAAIRAQKGRDGFFYYLLISNLVLLGIIIALVFKAVVTTYFA